MVGVWGFGGTGQDEIAGLSEPGRLLTGCSRVLLGPALVPLGGGGVGCGKAEGPQSLLPIPFPPIPSKPLTRGAKEEHGGLM